MKRLSLSLRVALVVVLMPAAIAAAQGEPEFKLGFKILADGIPDIAGSPIENEHYAPNGDSQQLTANGLMVWRKADNWTAFTNGAWTWINGPNGIQDRGNEVRFDWEAPGPTAAPTPRPAPTPIPYTRPGYRYIDPRALFTDPTSYTGQKVSLKGTVESVIHTTSSRVVFDASVEGFSPMRTQRIAVLFQQKQPGILPGDAIVIYGTAGGSARLTVIGDAWEPWLFR